MGGSGKALCAGLAAAAPVALWLLARRRPKERAAIVAAWDRRVRALVARLRTLIAADEEAAAPPPRTPPRTPQRDPPEAYAFAYRLDLQGDAVALAAEAVAWVSCKRAVADACQAHRVPELTNAALTFDLPVGPTTAPPCVARFLAGLAAHDDCAVLVKVGTGVFEQIVSTAATLPVAGGRRRTERGHVYSFDRAGPRGGACARGVR